MKKYFAVYRAPVSVLEEWAKTSPKKRKPMEEKMRGEWGVWMKKHESMVTETAGLGKTKLVTPKGVSDAKNDMMLYSIVEAESHEAAAKIFEGHPHLGIPEASIEIMGVNVLPGMSS